MSAAKRPTCGHPVTRGDFACGGITLDGGQRQACGERASQRIVTASRIAFRCTAHEFAAELASPALRLFPVESAA